MNGNGTSATRRFNPNEHLRTFERRQRQLDGSYKTVSVDYLDVKWRIVWFRQEHPEGSIVTELLSQPGVSPAVVRATVTLENGVTATGLGQCGEDDWSDWLEKAETRAIGRALALLGYGTQFCEEFDEIISDSPVEDRGSTRYQPATSDAPMTVNQRNFILSLAREAGIDQSELEYMAEGRFGHGLDQLRKVEASSLIDSLQARRNEQPEAEPAGAIA